MGEKDIALIIGLKVDALKKSKGLTNDHLGEFLNVSRQTISKYLKGEQIIDSGKLFMLAKKFCVPVEFFFNDEQPNFTFMFRADNPKKNIDETVLSKFENLLMSYRDILEMSDETKVIYLPEEYKVSIKGKKLSDEEKEIIRAIAERQRKAMGLNESGEVDLYEVLERNGINVLAIPLQGLELDAVSAFSEEKGAFIFLNDLPHLPEERKIFSVAHELGHLILHRDDYNKGTMEMAYNSSRDDVHEKSANHFASCFLIPRVSLRAYSKKIKFWGLQEIVRYKRIFNVSAKALLLALLDEKIIAPGVYGVLNKRLNQEGYDTVEPHPMQYIEKNQSLINLLKTLYTEDKLTVDKIREVLNLSLLEARTMVKKWDVEVEYEFRED